MANEPKVYEFDNKDDTDVTGVFLEKTSEALSKKGVEPDAKWFQGKSGFFADLGRTLNEPKSLWDRLKNYWINISIGVGIGGATGAGLGSIVPGVGTILGGLMGAVVGAAASAITQPITAIVNFFGSRGGKVTTAIVDTAIGTGLVGTAVFNASQGLGRSLGMILNQAEFLYDFNFDIPDSQIWQQIKALIDGLYSSAGDFIGSSFARLLLTGSLEPPKIEIDIRGLSLAYSEFAEDKREDLLQGVSSFAFQGTVVAQRCAFLFAFLRGRNEFKKFIQSRPDIEKKFPEIANFAKEWGDEENPNTKENEVKDWRISTWVEGKIDDIKKTYGQQIGSFVENLVESFGEETMDILQDYVVYKFV